MSVRVPADRFRSLAIAAAIAAGLLGGCAGQPAVEPAAQATPQPGDRFVLPAAGTDVVGRVQVAIARAEDTYASMYQWQNCFDQVAAHAQRAEDAYRRLGHAGQVDTSVVLAAWRGTTTVKDAVRVCDSSLALHAEHPRHRAYLRTYLGILHALDADIHAARGAAAAARSELEELGEELGLGTSALAHLGAVEAILGDWARAEETWQRGIEYTRDRPQLSEWHGYFLARLGEAALGRGDPGSALRLAERARVFAAEADVESAIWWRRVAACALAATGHPRKALRLGREALAIVDGTDDVLLRAGARLDLAEVRLRAADSTEALALVQEGLDLLDRKGAVLPAAQSRARFAELLVESTSGGAAVAAPLERPF